MNGGGFRLLAMALGAVFFTVPPMLVSAQEDGGLPRSIEIRPFNSFAPVDQNIPLALGNFLGPVLLGPLFDSLGRKPMIAGTYIGSGLLLVGTGLLFQNGLLGAVTLDDARDAARRAMAVDRAAVVVAGPYDKQAEGSGGHSGVAAAAG